MTFVSFSYCYECCNYWKRIVHSRINFFVGSFITIVSSVKLSRCLMSKATWRFLRIYPRSLRYRSSSFRLVSRAPEIFAVLVRYLRVASFANPSIILPRVQFQCPTSQSIALKAVTTLVNSVSARINGTRNCKRDAASLRRIFNAVLWRPEATRRKRSEDGSNSV